MACQAFCGNGVLAAQDVGLLVNLLARVGAAHMLLKVAAGAVVGLHGLDVVRRGARIAIQRPGAVLSPEPNPQCRPIVPNAVDGRGVDIMESRRLHAAIALPRVFLPRDALA